MNCSTPALPAHHQLLESTQTQRPSNHLILCHPLLLLPSIFPSIKVFSNESALRIDGGQSIGVSASTSVLPWTSRTDLLQDGLVGFPCSRRDSQESSPAPQFKASILQHSAFFMVQLSHPYMTTGKTIALTRWTFVGKVASLLFNMLSRLVITFLPRSKRLLFHGCSHHLQWFWSPQNKVSHCFHCFPIYLPWSDGTRCHDLSFLNVEL